MCRNSLQSTQVKNSHLVIEFYLLLNWEYYEHDGEYDTQCQENKQSTDHIFHFHNIVSIG
jgi:hypothetical protein